MLLVPMMFADLLSSSSLSENGGWLFVCCCDGLMILLLYDDEISTESETQNDAAIRKCASVFDQ